MLALPHHTLVICGFYFNNARQSRVFEELLFCVSDGMLKCRNCFRNPRRILDRPFLKASFIHPFLSTSFFLFPSSASLFSNFHHFHVHPPPTSFDFSLLENNLSPLVFLLVLFLLFSFLHSVYFFQNYYASNVLLPSHLFHHHPPPSPSFL